jgi:hypothetical protein
MEQVALQADWQARCRCPRSGFCNEGQAAADHSNGLIAGKSLRQQAQPAQRQRREQRGS